MHELSGPVTTEKADGYSINLDRRRALVERWSPALEAALAQHEISEVVLDVDWDPRAPDLDRLARVVTEVTLVQKPPAGWEAIYAFPRLTRLSVAADLPTLDWRRLPTVEQVSLQKRARPGNVAQAPALKRLYLWNGVEDLEFLDGATALQTLAALQCSRLRTLQGVERVSSLHELRLEYLPKLQSIRNLAGLPCLRTVSIQNAKRIADLEAVGDAPALSSFHADFGPVITSLGPFGSLPALEVLDIRNTSLAPEIDSIVPLLAARALRRINFWRVKLTAIGDLGRLGELEMLESLTMGNTGPIASLAAWSGFPRLGELELGGPVKDKNLAPLLQLPVLRPSELIYPYPFTYPANDDRLARLLRPQSLAPLRG